MPTPGQVRRQVARWWPGGAEVMAGVEAMGLMDEMAAKAMAAAAARAHLPGQPATALSAVALRRSSWRCPGPPTA